MNEKLDEMVKCCGIQSIIDRYCIMSNELKRIVQEMESTGKEKEARDASLIDDAKNIIDKVLNYLNSQKESNLNL